jgi:plasmid stability protein
MKNVTITLDEEVARWARVWAARHDTSVSRFLRELLQERMLQEEGYEAAMRHYLAVTPRALKTSGGYPTRTEAHERSRPERSRP